jgi:class 3 adenylate cyclase/tetratricopeptide (TPR) repeat protein
MPCSNCQCENPATARFCSNCGKPLTVQCPSCNSEILPNARFCSQCGAPLTTPPASPASPEPPPLIPTSSVAITNPTFPADGERRHLTVLFCDLAGSAAIAAGLDPEDWRATIAAYHRSAAEAITRLGGHVAKYLGDGVMAFFGYPEAHDNDAERATRAGLAILDALVALNESSAHPRLAARIGIDSGPVVVGAGAGPGADVFGDVPNIAARVQAAADPDSVFVTAATHRLIHGLFITEDRGEQPLKGIAESIRLHRVVRPSGARGRLEATAASRGLTPFVGRDDELRMLTSRWERARDGEGQVALIIGEAGIGKSRLLHRFRETLTGTPHSWIDAAAGAFFQNTPFYPVTEMLRQLVWVQSFNRLDDYLRNLSTGATSDSEYNPAPAEKVADEPLAQVLSGLAQAGLNPALSIPLLAPLLNLALPPEYPPSPLPPDQQRRRLLGTLVAWILGTARTQPLIIVIEDLHWADPSTLELIQLLVEQGNTAHLMLLYTARPEFRPPWPLRSHHAQINLNRLNARDVRTIVAQVAAQKALADETVSAVVDRTGGIPLFVEELTRVLLERGDARLTGREIPATLHDSLIARLDRLGPARETLQIAAVLGSDFSYELLHAVHPAHDHDELQRHLRTLTDAELLYVRGLAPDATYQFKHALIRDAAYEALLKSRRKELHRLVAQTIDSQFPAIKEKNPEVLAHHWTEAGETRLAIVQWQRAADAADLRASFVEAADGYQKAIALIAELGDSDDDLRSLELELSSSLVRVLTITKGFTVPESVMAVAQARAVAEKSGNLKELALREYATWNAVFASGNHTNSAALAAHLLELALQEGSATSLAFAYQAQLSTNLFRGNLIELEEHFRNFSGVCDQADFSEFPSEKLCGFTFASIAAWILGKPDTARTRMARGVACASETGHPYDLAFASFYEAWLYQLLREYERAEAAATQALAMAEQHGFPFGRELTRPLLGWARVQLGHAGEGVSLIRQGLAGLAETGSKVGITAFLAHLAEAQALAGTIDDALSSIEEALQANPEELAFRPHALICRGELRLKAGQAELAEADFREAITLAQKMQAKAWELRATTSLARLLRDTGRRDEARAMLDEIYNWFTEGFDTADLKDAKALLDELSNISERQ